MDFFVLLETLEFITEMGPQPTVYMHYHMKYSVFLLFHAIQCNLTTTIILYMKETLYICTGLVPYKEIVSILYKDLIVASNFS
jgi:hypothetical protein